MKIKLSTFEKEVARQPHTDLRQDAGKYEPRLFVELANAIIACEKIPWVPCSDELDGGGIARYLPADIKSIKNDLPLFLSKSSAADISELTGKLRACARLWAKDCRTRFRDSGCLAADVEI